MSKLNKYINTIKRVEFTVTHACTGNCKHCSVGKTTSATRATLMLTGLSAYGSQPLIKGKEKLDKLSASNVLIELSKEFQVESVMTFGGEPLLFSDTTFAIHKTAKEYGIPVRQIITNGYFTNDVERIRDCANKLAESGINDVLLSVDCFHQEYIPIEKVHNFASFLKQVYKGRLRLQPAWVVNESHDNPYNSATKEHLAFFNDLKLECGKGNNIFPAGNALEYLAEYFDKKPIDTNFKCGQAPYTTDLECINEISINPNGDVVACSFPIGNIYTKGIMEILADYNPHENPYTSALLNGGINGLIEYSKTEGRIIDISKYYSPCEICRDIANGLT